MKQSKDEKLMQKATELKKAYNREWAKKNRDKIRANQMRYWMRKAAELEGSSDQEESRGTSQRIGTS